MKFYDCATAPSPRRVRIFIAEKGLEIDTVEVDMRRGEHLAEPFRRLNPRCTLPALELDDGTCLTEAVAVCRYLEVLHPEPPLFGRDAREQALVLMWNARCENDGFYATAEAFRNRAKGLRNRALPGPHDYAQIPALAERGAERVRHFLDELDARLADSPFIAGEHYSIADITAMVAIDFAGWIKLGIAPAQTHLARWYGEVSTRPSAAR